MKSFFTKFVASIIFAVILCGFFYFDVTKAVAETLRTDYPTNLPTDSSINPDLATRNRQTNLINEKLNLENAIKNSGNPATAEQQARLDQLETEYKNIGAGINAQSARQNFITGVVTGGADIAAKIAGGIASGLAFTVQSVIIYVLELTITPIVSFYLAVSGKVLNFTVQYTIYGGFGNFYETIKAVWVLTRDMFNITFIFMLLYIAISQIIGSAGINIKKMLGSIIISALLINFSLFVSRVIIDGGNMIANVFLNQIEVIADPANGIFQKLDNTLNTANQIQLSERIVGKLGLQSFLDPGSELPSISTQQAINSVIKLLLFLITSFMFTFMALLLLGRFVMLIFLMAVSPIGFIGSFLPKFGQASKWWWGSLIDQTLVAPVFMFFMLLIIKLASNLPKASGLNMVSYFNYIFLLFLIFKAISITKGFSGKLGGFADQIASAATGSILGAATAGSSNLLQQTIGRGAAAIASSDALKAAAAKSGVTGVAARLALKAPIVGVGNLSKATFDIRNAPGAQKTFGLIKSEGGVDIAGGYAKGAKGGFVESKEAYAKAQTEFAKSLKRSEEDTKEEAMQTVRKKQEAEQKEREGQFKKTQDEIIVAKDKTQDEVNELTAKLDGAKITEDPEKIKQAEDKLKKKKEEQANQEKEFQERERQAKENLDKKAEEAKKGFDDLVKQEQKNLAGEYQRRYANVEEKSTLAGASTVGNIAIKTAGVVAGLRAGKEYKDIETITAYNKAAAEAIRKQAKGKSTADEAKELLKKIEKEKEEAEGKKEEEKKPEEKAEAKPEEKPKAP